MEGPHMDTLVKIYNFIKLGFYYIWKMDILVFLVAILGILLLLLFAYIYGLINKSRYKKDKESDKP